MTSDGKNPSKILDLEERIEQLEAQVRVLMLRTIGLVKLGGNRVS